MVSTFTTNIQLEEPARGDQVGTWDTPVNNNMTLIDLVCGGKTTIGLNNSNVVLSSPQYECKTIIFNSTLTGSVTITFPTSFQKSYEIQNLCTGTSAFTITLQTTNAGTNIIGCKPGETFTVRNDGISLNYVNLGHIGSYWDYAGSSVPNWVEICSVDPYLNCDGSTFSATTYPALATILGSTTLPDRRGTAGYTLNQGTGRLTTAGGGLDGNTLKSLRTAQTITIATSNLPAYTPAGTISVVSNAAVPVGAGLGINPAADSGVAVWFQGANSALTSSGILTGTAQGGVSAALSAIGTGTVTGICLIRSA